MKGIASGLASVLVLGILAAPCSSEAQQPGKVPRIGVIAIVPGPTPITDTFVRRLRELGYVVGENLLVEWRWAAGKTERFPEFARELADARVDLIVAASPSAIAAASGATRTIPVVMVAAADPVRLGLAASFARPGGNMTGVTFELTPDIVAKQVELLKDARPGLTRVAVLVNPTQPGHDAFVKAVDDAARRVRVTVQRLSVTSVGADVEAVFAAATRDGAEAVLILPDAVLYALRQTLADLAARNHLPSIFSFAEFPQAGGFMSYGPSLSEQWHRAASFVDRILKGARPGDLPIERPTRFEMIVNLRTARSIGLAVPPALLLRADQTIE